MTEFLVGGYGADMRGTAAGVGWGRSHPDGRFEYLGVAFETESPSWITVDGERVFAVLEGAAAVESLELRDGGGRLERTAPVAAVPGSYPCHLAVDGGFAVTSCYGDGVVWVQGVGPSGLYAGDGQSLRSEAPRGPLDAQEGPHAHWALPVSGGVAGEEHVLTADLGTDRVHVHGWAPDGSGLARTDSLPMPPGTGPRDLLALPDGRVAVLGEWSCEVLLLEPRGTTYEVVQIVALPGATVGSDQAAGLSLSTDGRFLFAGLRGADRIASLELDADTAFGVGWVPSGGRGPRHTVVDGGFLHVANQLSSTVTSFAVEPDGTLTSVGDPATVPSPTCLVALP